MQLHASATLTIVRRRQLVRSILAGVSISEAARSAGVSRQTASKWWHRFQASGDAGLADRTTRPHRSPRRSSEQVERRVVNLRISGWSVHQIARRLRLAVATVYWIAKRWGLNRLSILQGAPPPVVRYERERPGELVHMDIKKLRRIGDRPGWRVTGRQPGYTSSGTGYDHIHVAIDDRTRLAFAMAMPDEKTVSCVRFMREAKRWYAAHGIHIERIMTDNGSGYKTRWKLALTSAGIKPRYTRPYRPQTNGKAERMIQTLLREWAYNQPYHNNAERLTALSDYLNYYNHDRAHTALGGSSPHERAVNDLLKNNI